MVKIHNLGFPRIGAKRELKFALEAYWNAQESQEALKTMASQLRKQHWQSQEMLDLIPVGDFSLYDHVLDMSFMLGNIPSRIVQQENLLDNYFQVARGRSVTLAEQVPQQTVVAAEMTKWFDTNYHYIVPELMADTAFILNPSILLDQITEAKQQLHSTQIKPVIIGPVTYLFLGKALDNSDKLRLLPKILAAYNQLLEILAQQGIEWVQIDEPILVMDLSEEWKRAFIDAYAAIHQHKNHQLKLLLTTYFGCLQDNVSLVCQLDIQGLHVDTTYATQQEIQQIVQQLPSETVLSLGVISGRNIWKSNLNQLLEWLEPIAESLGNRLWLAPSCSLLHVPIDLQQETLMDEEVKSWLAFALQKLEELYILKSALNAGRDCVKTALNHNQQAILSRQQSARVHNLQVKEAVSCITAECGLRQNPYIVRVEKQRQALNLPLYPTTTIGSFPQTTQIRQIRNQYRQGKLGEMHYQQAMYGEIEKSIQYQKKLGLDVLVHGEAERNDMVEYFGEQLAGYVFSQSGWVQSYGSRCVKPPILFGDICRLGDMTVQWISYAQSLTDKPMKGMLTGPVTMLNWSFVRDDQPREVSCYQLALAIREEVLALEKAGIKIIQIDEAALREGLPLRRSERAAYLNWAVTAFKISANGVSDQTQIHTHMCYSEFNDIMPAIAAMDADVITIETSRSNGELLKVFENFDYPNEMGPGVYDIHSPNIPSVDQMVNLIQQAEKYIPAERLWMNPDCGLKTRQWSEVIPALENMVSAAKTLRQSYGRHS